MDFGFTLEIEDLQRRVRHFINEVAIPAEARAVATISEWEPLRAELQTQAQEAGLFLPHLPPEWGGMGLEWRTCAIVFEEAGRTLLGPHALNCAAPDEGNMHLLAKVATPPQKEKFLRPLAEGQKRSCFSMTEPAPGAGADPSLLKTSAIRQGNRWVINGRKWFITGAKGAAFTIVMARTGEVEGRAGATMFLVESDNPGFRVIRKIPTLDTLTPGGHCEVEFCDCEVGDDAILGEVGKGFDYAQVRLGPARLTHCMRWLGAARRALDFAIEYTAQRNSFGVTLADHQAMQWMVADSEIELHASRLMIWHAAWRLDQGDPARQETSMAKVFVGETVNRVIDRAVQMCGATGIAEDEPLAMLYRENRPFRIYDGPSEVHRMSIAKRIYRQASAKGRES